MQNRSSLWDAQGCEKVLEALTATMNRTCSPVSVERMKKAGEGKTVRVQEENGASSLCP